MKDEMEILSKIEANVGTMLGSQKEATDRIEKLSKDHDALTARALATDERLKTLDQSIHEIETKTGAQRMSLQTGADTLLEAMTPELKAWIPRVAVLQGGVASRSLEGDVERSEGQAKFARKDPVLYVALAGWFQAKLKAALAVHGGQMTKAQEWSDKADTLAKGLGGYSDEAKASLAEDTGNVGGYLVPTITEAMIGVLLKEASVVRAAGPTMIQMTAKTHQLPTLANDFTVSWFAEAATITDAAPSVPFGQGNLVANKQGGLVTLSVELIQDNIINLMDFIMSHLIQQMGRAEDLQALEGTGAPFSGLYTVSGTGSVAGGTAALSEAMLRKLIYGAEHASTLDGTVMFCHPWIMRDALGLTVSSGNPWFPYVFGTAQQGNGRPTNIWGIPVYMTSVISRVRTANDTTVYHGKPSAIVIGDRLGTTFDVDPYGLFSTGQVRLRLMRRVAILIWVPGYWTKLTAVTVAV